MSMNNTNKPLLLFDIDLTLYDTNLFRQLYPPVMAKAMNISIQTLNKTQKSYTDRLAKSTDFLPEDFLHHIADVHNRSYEKLHDIYYNPENFHESLYPDVFPSLQRLKGHHTLGIFSEGFISFQTTKLKLSGIYNFFDPNFIFITRRKNESDIISQLPVNTTIIDDRIEVLESLSQFPNLTLVWLNRKDHSSSPTTKTIHSLTQLT